MKAQTQWMKKELDSAKNQSKATWKNFNLFAPIHNPSRTHKEKYNLK